MNGNEEMKLLMQLILQLKKHLRLSDAVFTVINTQKNAENMFEYFRCAVCGIPDTEILNMTEADLTAAQICEKRTELLVKIYRDHDGLYNEIKNAGILANELAEKNTELRTAFEQDIKEALLLERKANEAALSRAEETIEAKDRMLELWQTQAAEADTKYNNLKEKYEDLKNLQLKSRQATDITAKAGPYEAEAAKKADCLQEPLKQKNLIYRVRKKCTRFKQEKQLKKQQEEFAEKIIKNSKYTEAKKMYLIGCINSGVPFDMIFKVAAPTNSVEIMEQLLAFYNKK